MTMKKTMTKTDDPSEEWKDISGYEGLYQVSNLGRIKALDRFVKNRRAFRPGRIMPYGLVKSGYRRTLLCKDNVQKCHSVHRFVALAFIPNPDNKPEVNHINGIKHDNRVENLEWCTHQENLLHSSRVLGVSFKGVIKARLTPNDIMTIIRLASEGMSKIALSKRYNVSVKTIRRHCRTKAFLEANKTIPQSK